MCEISSSVEEGGRVLTVVGDVDLGAGEKLEAEIAGAAGDLDPGAELVLDLAGVGFLDSAGLRALLRGADAASAAEVRLAFVLSPAVTRVFELTRIGPKFFGIAAPDWDSATS
ncbi:STAS domain-containing protein [Actinospica sp.]|uniref:STAS domain-containing protein n=1 Tax=Actinospica sp. TaxID=1872142 RepID=UPI002BE3B19C|nr:STAS domain-containing protein [Actinospica sp.]HWG26156.1 STAS domain-containing protein [Actinospica sp.]